MCHWDIISKIDILIYINSAILFYFILLFLFQCSIAKCSYLLPFSMVIFSIQIGILKISCFGALFLCSVFYFYISVTIFRDKEQKKRETKSKRTDQSATQMYSRAQAASAMLSTSMKRIFSFLWGVLVWGRWGSGGGGCGSWSLFL